MTRLSTGKGFENFQWWDTGFLIFSGNERGHAPLSTVRVVNDHDKKKEPKPVTPAILPARYPKARSQDLLLSHPLPRLEKTPRNWPRWSNTVHFM